MRPTGKAWVYRYKRHGKEAKLSIGHYPVVTLAAARRKARAEAEKRAEGERALGRKPPKAAIAGGADICNVCHSLGPARKLSAI
ncbi:Arm DNA-binding domain-containing protein [Variovorax sp. RB3P1]|uniref:Arm DNA-binding domain-containing protein n=1 Tax=Variovorax sp. RB3P1 TaxID=3443732 RepID=UPI003F446F8F